MLHGLFTRGLIMKALLVPAMILNFMLFCLPTISHAEETPYMSAFKMGMSKQEVESILGDKFNYRLGMTNAEPKLFPTDENPYGILPGSQFFQAPATPGLKGYKVEPKQILTATSNIVFLFADDKLIQAKVWHDGVSSYGLQDKLQEAYGGRLFTVGKGISEKTYFTASTPDCNILLERGKQDTTNTFVYYLSLDSDEIIDSLIERGKQQIANQQQQKLDDVRL